MRTRKAIGSILASSPAQLEVKPARAYSLRDAVCPAEDKLPADINWLLSYGRPGSYASYSTLAETIERIEEFHARRR